MKEKILDKLKEFGPITGVLVVAVVAIFTVNGITGFNPGGMYAPGGEKAVGETKDAPADANADPNATTGGTNELDASNIVGSSSQTVTSDGSGGSVGLDENGQVIQNGNSTGIPAIGDQSDIGSLDTSPDAPASDPSLSPPQ